MEKATLLELTVEHIWRTRNAVDRQVAEGFLSCIGEVRHFLRTEASSCRPEVRTELLQRLYSSAGSLGKGRSGRGSPRRFATVRGSHWSLYSDGGCYSDQRRLSSLPENSIFRLDVGWGLDVGAMCPGLPSSVHRVMQFSRQATDPVLPPAPSSFQRPLHPCDRSFAATGPPREMDAPLAQGNGSAYEQKLPPISGLGRHDSVEVWRPW